MQEFAEPLSLAYAHSCCGIGSDVHVPLHAQVASHRKKLQALRGTFADACELRLGWRQGDSSLGLSPVFDEMSAPERCSP